MRRWFTSGIAVVVASAFLVAPGAVAAPAPAGGSPGQGLEISPPVVQLTADPGQTVTTQIRVRNVTSGELIAKGRADDFGAGTDESGNPKLLLDETGATRYSLKYWIGSVPDLDLTPQQLKTTTITVRVPANAEPGGHYGLVRFTALPPNLVGTGVALSASVGTLILLKVNGAVTEKLSMAEFSTGVLNQKTEAYTKKGFFEYGPVDFLVRIKNDGSVHEKPVGSITIKNTFGVKSAMVSVNDKGGNVLPDSIRRFPVTLANKKLFGYYTANLALTYANGQKLSATTSFWVIPWKLIVLALIGLVVLLYLLRLGVRRYNEHIIAMARRR
jgi:hypothetical protein